VIAAVERGEIAVSAAHQFSKQLKHKQKQRLASAQTTADAVRSDRCKRAIDIELLGSVPDVLPKKPRPKRSKPDPELYRACRSYEIIGRLPDQVAESKVFWRCVEVHHLTDIKRSLKQAITHLETLMAIAMRTRH
jgi:hypothetical protein